MKKILIIADYGQKVGTGHYVRCSLLAKKLSSSFKVDLFSSNKIYSLKTIDKIKYFYHKNITDFKKINNFVSKFKYSFLIIDTYRNKHKLIENINFPKKNIFCFDDFCTKKISTNLINQNPFFKKTDYIKNKYKIYSWSKIHFN